METTLLSLAKSVMSGVADKAKSAIREEVALQLGVHGDLAFINDEFEMMTNFLTAADEEGGEKKVVRTWVKQVRDLGYDVEDSLMDYALHLDKQSWWRFPCTLSKRHAIANDIKDLKARVEDVSHRNLRYRLIEDPSSKPTTDADRYLSSTASVFGIDGARSAAKHDSNKKQDLVDLITKENEELRVITVWGTSSDAGKMSTIRKVYDNPKVTRNFGCRAWVKLVHPFNPAEFLKSLVRQFYGNSGGLIEPPQQGRSMGVHISRSMAWEKEELEDEYDKHVNNHKYLIVIEDLSTVSEWDWIKLYLPDKMNGSRIIVSTQQIELASVCVGEPNQVSELKQFSSEQTLYIFHQKEETELSERDEADSALTEARERVIKLIAEEYSKQREIISVWGTDGPQKTALLRSIYDSKELDSNQFQKRAWITVSHPAAGQVSLVLELTTSCPVLEENPDANVMEALELIPRLMGRQKCLIVLEGISSSKEWGSLVNYLPRDKDCSSRIVLTTTDRSVAKRCSVKAGNTYKLEVLEDEIVVDGNITKDSDVAERARTEARDEVIKLISQDSKKCEIISVWGEDSFQNTALIRSIYNGKELDSNKFQKCAWITVSHPTADQVSLVLELKVSSPVLLDNPEATEAVELIQELDKLLRRHKYLLILDGISGSTEWDSLVKHLPAEETASRMVVSTVEQSVAEHCSVKKRNTYNLDVQEHDVADDPNKNKKQPAGTMPESKFSSTPDSRKTELEEPQLIGREADKSRIINMLNGTAACQVIFVSGTGGVGKSALVDSIYRSPDIIERFPSRAWANVLQPFVPEEFHRILSLQLSNSDRSNLVHNILSRRQSSSTDTTEELLGLLKGKKHLIVVDGLSSETEWEKGVKCLRESAGDGSCIIVTTREASFGGPCSVSHVDIKCLKEADAFQLFKTKVSKAAENFESDPEMMEQAKHIVRKCGGLPLAISTIGGFLSGRPASTMEWRKLNDHIGVQLEMNLSLESINKIVISSYKGLPYHLKACFLYLSIFPEGHNLRRRRLIRRWIAESYSSEKLTLSAEEVGEEYFTNLMSRSMIQPSKATASNYGKVSLCQVNNLMHAISISKSKEEKLVSVLDNSGFSLNSRDKVRHLVVSSMWRRDKKNALERVMDVSRMRSLTVFGEWRRFLISSKMKLLRVLDLEDATGLRDNDLVPIGKLHHLKFLSLRGSQGIFNLPKSFGRLTNLETLDIRGTLVTTLPARMVKLQKLSYLRAGYIPENENDSSINIVEAIQDTGEIVYKIFMSMVCAVEKQSGVANNFGPLFCLIVSTLLKRVDPHAVKLPRRIGKLKNLHTLGVVNIATGVSGIKELKKLTKLRKLGVTGINKKNAEDFCLAISDLSQLESLSVRSEGKNGLENCLNGLSSVATNLQNLKLYGNLGKLPEGMDRLKNLAKLKLRSTRLVYKDAMAVLEKLPKLVILCLWRDVFEEGKKEEGKESRIDIKFGAGTFSNLKKLEIADLEVLHSITFEDGAMTQLEILLVQDCRKFYKGGFNGVNSLPKLKEVWVKGNSTLKFKIN